MGIRAVKYALLLMLIVTGCRREASYPPQYYQARDLFEAGEYDAVVEILDEVKFSEKAEWFYYYYGMSQYRRENKRYVRLGIRNLGVAIAYDGRPDYYYYIGQMYFDIAEYRKARSSFSRALAAGAGEEPPNVNLWMALTLHKLGSLDVSEFERS